MSAAASTASTPRSVLAAAWAVMLVGGGANVAFNIFHAVHWGNLNAGFALLYGLVPVFISMCQSHIVAEHRGAGQTVKVITFGLMTAAMANSAGSTATVLRPTAGPFLCWLFPVTLDAGALVALYVILNYRSRQAAEADALTAAETMRAEAAATVIKAEADRDAALERAAAERATAQENAAAEHAETARIAAELAAVRAELAAARERQRSRKPTRTAGRKTAGSSARKPARVQPEAAAADGAELPPGISAGNEAEGWLIMQSEPDITGAELGRRLGLTERGGRDVMGRIKRLGAGAADPTTAGPAQSVADPEESR